VSANHLIQATRLRIAAGVIAVVGLLAAVTIYATASDVASANGVRFDFVNGQPFVIKPQESAHDQRELQRLGGTAAVMTLRFSRWFDSLWRGRRLAYTVATLSIVVALGCWYVAGLMAEDVDPSAEG
jgi:hypothetical protein